MTKKKNQFNCYVESRSIPGSWQFQYVGKCYEYPEIEYIGKEGTSRDAALSGIRRAVIKHIAREKSFTTEPQKPEPEVIKSTGRIKENRIAFVIDRSSSMTGIMPNVASAYNSNVNTILDQALSTGQRTFVSMITFGSHVDNIVHNHVTPNRATWPADIQANGMTALYDAVNHAINTLKSKPEDPDVDVSYLVMTLTDGHENASQMNSSTLKCKIQQLVQTDKWTFTFLVPPGAGRNLPNSLGVYSGNIMEWTPDKKGVDSYRQSNDLGLSSYYSNRKNGIRSTSTFYTTIMPGSSQTIRNLLDIRNQVVTIDVKSTGQIREVCEKTTGLTYVPGMAYYQLLKPEKVQYHKSVIIVDKTTNAIYFGHDARNILGIPVHLGEIKVAPGVHGNYEVYVQSTSVNRKVYPGSKIIYVKN